jgi:hypothetical protein
VYDAIKAGFNKLVFVIRPHFEQEFKESVSSKYASLVEVTMFIRKLIPRSRVLNRFRKRKAMGLDTLY